MGPHGYSSCSLPPAAAYSHSDSLGRNPPSQMQKAYASCHMTQLIGRFSCPPDVGVQVAKSFPLSLLQTVVRFASVGEIFVSSAAAHPGSNVWPELTLGA